MDWQREVSDATEFVEGVKLDIFQDQVFVFTPQGRRQGPAGGRHAARLRLPHPHRRRPRVIGAKVNNRLVPLDYKLKNGDIVEIVTTKSAHGPSRDWLNIVTTSHAKEKIRQWFKRQQRDENIVHGKAVAGPRAAAAGAHLAREDHHRRQLDEIVEQYALRRRWTTSTPPSAMARSAPSRSWSRLGVVDDDANEAVLPQVAPTPPTRTGGIRVKGVGDLLVRFSKCCHPIPGDPIVGFITRGRGVTVHLATCPTVVNEKDVARLIEVEWETAAQQTYPIAIRIEAYDRTGLLSDISNVVADDKINIIAAHVTVHPDHRATVQATLQVTSVAQLARVMARLEQLKDVYSVQRDLN